MKPVPRHRRRRFYLPRTGQARLLLSAQLILVGLTLVTGVILLLVTSRDLTASYMAAHLAIKNVQEILLPTLVLVDLLGLLLGGVVLLFYTHRIAGPVYRLCQILQRVSQGDLTQGVNFRKGDHLQELATAVNQMLEQIHAQLREMRQHVAVIESAWERREGDALPPESQQEVVAALQALRRGLDRFKLERDLG